MGVLVGAFAPRSVDASSIGYSVVAYPPGRYSSLVLIMDELAFQRKFNVA